MLAILPFTALLGSFAAQVAADSSFKTPGGSGSTNFKNNPKYDVGESMNVEWETDLDKTNLLLWQDYPAAGGGTQFFVGLKENTTSTSMIWNVNFGGFSTDIPKGTDAVFHFALYKSGTDDIHATSAFFNVTVPKDEATSATKAPTSALPSPSSSTGTLSETTTGAAAEKTTGSSSDKDEGGLSTGAVAGVAVGATIGGIALLAGAGFLLWRHFRKGSGPAAAAGGYEPPSEMSAGAQNQPAHEYYKPPQAPAEMAGQSWIHPPQNGYQGPGGLHEAP
ncbi:Crumbs protein like protein 3 [Fusarium austroafricanum]|uniref:Crumbs protein like protein 3 n=1 Tax=Fusarium austroafricanum TaxID=2364996 RepID=A0A8H4KHK2_9HYPO|nr:Crumbs protein like protein 3 [Fusarium austroafricanum]